MESGFLNVFIFSAKEEVFPSKTSRYRFLRALMEASESFLLGLLHFVKISDFILYKEKFTKFSILFK